MGWAGSGGLESFGARQGRIRWAVAALFVAVLCLASTPSVEAPAQTAPWDIEAVQHRLLELGYDAGRVDGLLGPKTRGALWAFQADRGLPVTGLPDGATQRALLVAEPLGAAAEATPSPDDPPSLEAVPLGPVQVAPLAPLVGVTPHEGLSAEQASAERPGASAPPADPDQGSAAAQGDWLAELGSWETGLKWAAVALGVLGLVSIIATAVLKLAHRKPVATARPRPAASPRPARTATAETRPPKTTTTRPAAHVFGVDVPSSENSRSE